MEPQTDDFYGEQTEDDVLFEMEWFLDHNTPEQVGPLPSYLVAQIEDFARRGYDMRRWQPYLEASGR